MGNILLLILLTIPPSGPVPDVELKETVDGTHICFTVDDAYGLLQLRIDNPKLQQEIVLLNKLVENNQNHQTVLYEMIALLEDRAAKLSDQNIALQRQCDIPIYKNKFFILTVTVSVAIVTAAGIYSALK